MRAYPERSAQATRFFRFADTDFREFLDQAAELARFAPKIIEMIEKDSDRMSDTSLRVFSQRGAASPRDWTVCGVKRLLFPLAILRDYRFGLAFREHASGTLIRRSILDVSPVERRARHPCPGE